MPKYVCVRRYFVQIVHRKTVQDLQVTVLKIFKYLPPREDEKFLNFIIKGYFEGIETPKHQYLADFNIISLKNVDPIIIWASALINFVLYSKKRLYLMLFEIMNTLFMYESKINDVFHSYSYICQLWENVSARTFNGIKNIIISTTLFLTLFKYF